MDNLSAFQQDLTDLINRHSLEKLSGTPDFILAAYLVSCLRAFDEAATAEGEWAAAGPGEEPEPETPKS